MILRLLATYAVVLICGVGCQETLDDISKMTSHMEVVMRRSGSEVTDIHEFPYLVSVNSRTEFDSGVRILCTGILINPKSVLTTYTCVASVTPEQIEIRVGSYENMIEGATRRVSEMELYPGFRPPSSGTLSSLSSYAVALLTLDEPIEPGDKVAFAPLIISSEDVPKKMKEFIDTKASCSAVGYGIGITQLEDAGSLRRYNLSLTQDGECNSDSATADSNLVCASIEEENVCFYENGAPLICEGKVCGINEFVGEDCGSKTITFIRIDSLEDFLRDKLVGAVKESVPSPEDTEHSSNSKPTAADEGTITVRGSSENVDSSDKLADFFVGPATVTLSEKSMGKETSPNQSPEATNESIMETGRTIGINHSLLGEEDNREDDKSLNKENVAIESLVQTNSPIQSSDSSNESFKIINMISSSSEDHHLDKEDGWTKGIPSLGETFNPSLKGISINRDMQEISSTVNTFEDVISTNASLKMIKSLDITSMETNSSLTHLVEVSQKIVDDGGVTMKSSAESTPTNSVGVVPAENMTFQPFTSNKTLLPNTSADQNSEAHVEHEQLVPLKVSAINIDAPSISPLSPVNQSLSKGEDLIRNISKTGNEPVLFQARNNEKGCAKAKSVKHRPTPFLILLYLVFHV